MIVCWLTLQIRAASPVVYTVFMLLIEHPFLSTTLAEAGAQSPTGPNYCGTVSFLPGTTTGLRMATCFASHLLFGFETALTSFTTVADYIHPPKLVNMRYSR